MWENLARTTNDPETIDQAIDSAIATHNSDSAAHGLDDEALWSHRVNQVIDHPEESVVNDKIRYAARAFSALVGSDPEDDFDNIQSAADYLLSKGGGVIKLRPGAYLLDEDLLLSPLCSIVGEGTQVSIIASDSSTRRTIKYVDVFTERLEFAAGILNEFDPTEIAFLEEQTVAPVAGQIVNISPLIDGDPYDATVTAGWTDVFTVDTDEGTPGDQEADLQFYIGAIWTEDSDVIVLTGDQKVTDFGLMINMECYNIEQDFNAYITEIIDDTSFRVSRPFTGTTATYKTDCRFMGYHLPVWSQVTIGSPNAPVEIYNYNYFYKVKFDNCEFLSPGICVEWRTTDTGNIDSRPIGYAYFENCIISVDADDPAIICDELKMQFCIMTTAEDGFKGIECYGRAWINGNNFGVVSDFPSGYKGYWFISAGAQWFVTNCDLISFVDAIFTSGVSSTPANNVTITGCRIRKQSNSDISLGGTWQIWNGNQIFGEGSNGVELLSTFSRGVFLGNLVQDSVTNNSVNSQVIGNVNVP